jgi:hypothetical protein
MYQLHCFPSDTNATPRMVPGKLGQQSHLVLVARTKRQFRP